jgi:hypothetical protein
MALGATGTALPLLSACGSLTGGARKPTSRPAQPGPTAHTRTAQVEAPGRGIHPTAFPVTAIGVSWTGPQRGLRIRMLDRDGGAGDWQAVTPGCPCGKDPSSAQSARAQPVNRALVQAEGSWGYQLDATASIEVVNAIAIDAGLHPPLAGANGFGREPSTNSAPGQPSGRATLAASPPFPPAGLVTRAQWGAAESKRLTSSGREASPTQFFPAQAITVHHTVTSHDDPDPAATVRAIFEQHAVSNDWGDIGYHFLIDGQGRIYEGRFSGDDGVPAHDARGRVVTGFHTIGFNPGNIGIALLGDFTKGRQTPRMRYSLARLTASLAAKHRLDPLSHVTYRNPVSGRTKRARTIAGHRDWVSTECPGTAVYLELDRVRAQAARINA